MRVTVGSQNTFITEPTEFSVWSTRVIKHPVYNGGLGDSWGTGHDVCLLEVPNLTDAQPEACDDCWSPVCLPQDHIEPGTFCYVAGWGTTSSGGSASSEVDCQFLSTILISFS